jgi:hypothetical protein
MKPATRELFGSADVKDLGRGRYEITYSGFKDDRDAALFTVADGQVNLQRAQGGLAAQGSGFVTWTPLLKGNASIEISFRNVGDGVMGLVLASDPPRSGYLAVADLPVPGLQPLVIFRMPVKQGPEVITSFLAQGGTGTQVVKNAPTVASLTREGTKLKFVVGRGELNADSAQPSDGRVGIGLINTGVVIDRVKIVCEFDPAWLDAAK